MIHGRVKILIKEVPEYYDVEIILKSNNNYIKK